MSSTIAMSQVQARIHNLLQDKKTLKDTVFTLQMEMLELKSVAVALESENAALREKASQGVVWTAPQR